MKKYILSGVTLILMQLTLLAQNSVDELLMQIEQNNSTLAAYRKSIDAEKIANKTGLTLPDPEVEFGYLWSNPSVLGKRTDFSVHQSFDFPTAYTYRKRISGMKNEQSEMEYRRMRNEIMAEARLLMVDLHYHNQLHALLSEREAEAEQLAKAYKARFDAGEVSILEHNKAALNLLNSSKAVERNRIEQEACYVDLLRLNGGAAIDSQQIRFDAEPLPTDFNNWYEQVEMNNPMLQWLKQEISIRENEQKLARANALPKLHTGYLSEKLVGEHFYGVNVGITIPLWENKNRVKQARAESEAAAEIQSDAQWQFYNEMKRLHAKALSLQSSLSDYRNSLNEVSNKNLLQKALDKGQISLVEYLLELTLYYDSVDRILDTEKELNETLAELKKYI